MRSQYDLTIGEKCYIHPSAMLNAPIFRMDFVDGKPYREFVDCIPSTVIGNYVTIFANTTVEGGWNTGTIIKDHVHIDNNVLIGHDTLLEERVCVAGMTIVAGACTVGRDSFIGVGVTVNPEINIGERCYIGAGCTVYKDIPDGMVVREKKELVLRPNLFYPPNSLDIYPNQPQS
jgi:hypothetical protein